MSADNYLYVRKLLNGKWTVTMEFASEDEPRPVRESDRRFLTWAEAYKYAQEREQNEPYPVEYGIHSDSMETSEAITIDYETLSQDVEMYHLCPSCGNRYLQAVSIGELLERIQNGDVVDKIKDI